MRIKTKVFGTLEIGTPSCQLMDEYTKELTRESAVKKNAFRCRRNCVMLSIICSYVVIMCCFTHKGSTVGWVGIWTPYYEGAIHWSTLPRNKTAHGS